MARLLPLMALLLLALPTAHAQAGDAVAELRAFAIENPGPLRLEGIMDMVWVRDLGGPADGASGLAIAAQDLQVHQWSRTYAVDALGARVGTLPPEDDVDSYGMATASQAGLRPGYKLSVRGLAGHAPPTVAVDADCGRLVPTTSPRSIQMEGADSEWETPTDGLSWAGCRAWLAVAGDFEVRLWEWDLDVEGGGRARTYRSGEEGPPLAGNPLGGQDVRVSRSNTTILAATGGLLQVQLQGSGGIVGPEDAAQLVFLRSAVLRPEDGLTLRDVDGRMAGGQPVDGRSLDVEGDLVADVHRDGDSLRVSAYGRLAGARLDGAEVALLETQAFPGAQPSPARWVLAGAGAALAAVLAAAVLLRRARRFDRRALAARLRMRASRAEGRGGHLRATLLADAAVRLDPEHGDGYVLRAMARASRARTFAALADHRRAHHRLGGLARALNAFEAARAAALAERGDEAAQWLRIAMAHDAALLQEAALNPDFAPVAGHRAFRDLVGPSAGWATP